MTSVEVATPAAEGIDRAFACPSCGTQGLTIFHEQENVPVHSCRLLPSAKEATTFPRGSIRLGFCTGCGFIANTAFDASLQDYSVTYEETQGFSPRFQQFTRDLATRWVERYDLRGKNILEIGCGKGEFLVLMSEIGCNRGIGLDPSFVEGRLESEAAERIEFIRDYYSDAYAHLTGDAVICRHTLEHIHPAGEFVRLLRRSLAGRSDTVVLFEVPDVLRVLREVAFWDVYYEHCSYFTPGSLARLFRLAGFEVLDVALDYDDQYVLLEARPTRHARGVPLELKEEVEEVAREVARFGERFAATIAYWRGRLARARSEGRRVVIWGAGSKGVAFLTTLGLGHEAEYAVDVNPFKHGMYMAGTGQRLVPPDFLREYQPHIVVAMSPVYTEEIAALLASMGVDAELEAL